MTAAVQDRVGLSAIAEGVARFGDGPGAHACAVLEVTGAARSLASDDDVQQEAQLAACRQLLNALTFPVQLLARAEPARGRFVQHTVLEVPALLSLRGFRRR